MKYIKTMALKLFINTPFKIQAVDIDFPLPVFLGNWNFYKAIYTFLASVLYIDICVILEWAYDRDCHPN